MNPPKKTAIKVKELFICYSSYLVMTKKDQTIYLLNFLYVIYFITLVFVFIVFMLNRKASKVLNHQLKQLCVNSLLFNY